MMDRLEALQTIRVGLEETCAHLTTQLLAAERRLKETEAAGAALIDPLFALGVELQRLRERVAELEEHVRKGDRFIGAVERAEKAEAAFSRSRNVVSEERHLADVRGEMLTKAEAERDAALAQVAVLREALEGVGHWSEEEQATCWCGIPSMIPYRGHDGGCEAARAALASTPALDKEAARG